MRRFSLSWVAAAVVGAVAFSLASTALPNAALGDFQILSQSAKVDAIHGQVLFALVFSHAPNFLATDADGTQVESFQYEIDGDWTPASPGRSPFGFDRIDAVIRGGEIHVAGDLRVRDTRGIGDEDAGGWGRILASVPFDIDDDTLSFALPNSLFDDRDGVFQYRVFAMEHGALTNVIQAAVIPLPTAVWSGLSLFGGLCMIGILKRFRTRHAHP